MNTQPYEVFVGNVLCEEGRFGKIVEALYPVIEEHGIELSVMREPVALSLNPQDGPRAREISSCFAAK